MPDAENGQERGDRGGPEDWFHFLLSLTIPGFLASTPLLKKKEKKSLVLSIQFHRTIRCEKREVDLKSFRFSNYIAGAIRTIHPWGGGGGGKHTAEMAETRGIERKLNQHKSQGLLPSAFCISPPTVLVFTTTPSCLFSDSPLHHFPFAVLQHPDAHLP